MTPQLVYVWGFPPEELQGWPPDLQPQSVAELPVAEPVAVPASAAAAFYQLALDHPLPDGRTVDTIIMVPPGGTVPAETCAAAIIPAGDWRALHRLLACPQQFRVVEWADEVPLRQLTQPVETLDLPTLELPDDIKDHLRTCTTCPEAFRAALRQRLRLRRVLTCPPADRLVAFVRGEADAALERHLATCPLCSAQVAALRPFLIPTPAAVPHLLLTPAPVWARFSLRRPVAQAMDEQASRARAAFGVVADLFASILAQRWAVEGMGGVRQGAGQPAPPPPSLALLNNLLQAPAPLELTNLVQRIIIGWDTATRVPYLELAGEAAAPRITNFRVEVRQGDTVLWADDSRDGRLVLPPAEIEAALAAPPPADPAARLQIVILARE